MSGAEIGPDADEAPATPKADIAATSATAILSPKPLNGPLMARILAGDTLFRNPDHGKLTALFVTR